MKIAVRGGHNTQATGASALLDEVTEDRKVAAAVIRYLKMLGNEVLDVTPGPMNKNSDLAYGVTKATEWGAELFISIHFNNAYKSYNGAIGTETIIYPNSKSASPYAKRINDNLVSLGFKKHGEGVINDTRGLYELRHTKCAAVITEVCFVEATEDVTLYRKLGPDAIGKAIAEGITGQIINIENKSKYSVNYCLEFQKFYNKVTKTKAPISEDGIYDPNTERALQTITKIIREF